MFGYISLQNHRYQIQLAFKRFGTAHSKKGLEKSIPPPTFLYFDPAPKR